VTWTTVLLAGVIVAILVARAAWILRAEASRGNDGRTRGVAPGIGYTEIESTYASGVGGGSQSITRVPRDPQEYARVFVPKRAADEEKTR
jgi:hypothetical protein